MFLQYSMILAVRGTPPMSGQAQDVKVVTKTGTSIPNEMINQYL